MGVFGLCGIVALQLFGSEDAHEVRPLPVELLTEETSGNQQVRPAATITGTRLSDVLLESSRLNRYTVLYFYDSARTGAGKAAAKVASIVRKLPHQTAWVDVDVQDLAARPILAKYAVRSEPVTLLLAPNGAVTGGFRGDVSPEMLQRGFVSPKMAEVQKAIQQDKLVFLAFVGPALAESDAVRHATQQAETEMAGISKTIEVDPRDPAETQLLSQCGVEAASKVAETLVISPRGAIVRRFKGAITSQHLYDSFQSLLAQQSGCGSPPVTGGSACQPQRGTAGQSTCNE